MLIKRGFQKLISENKYDAIIFFGRAQEKLIQYDYREGLVRSLLGCGIAYKQAGLLWAARSCILAATTKSLSEYSEDGEIIGPILACFKELLWIEVLLGRLPHILLCFQIIENLADQIQLDIDDIYERILDRPNFDGVLSCLMLRSNDDQVKSFEKLPAVFDHFKLVGAECITLYMLGQEDKLISDGWFENNEVLNSFFTKMPQQPADGELPDNLELMEGETIKFHSQILGCNLTMHVENNSNSILISESIIGAIEAFLATSLSSELLPYKAEVVIKVETNQSKKNNLGLSIDISSQDYSMVISSDDEFSMNTAERMQGFRGFLLEIIGILLPRIAICTDFNKFFDRLKQEDAFGRGVLFSDVITMTANVLGDTQWLKLSDWTDQVVSGEISYIRNVPWLWKASKANKASNIKDESDLEKNFKNYKHSERKVVSLIDLLLWDQAGWKGVCTVFYPPPRETMGLCLVFSNEEVARSIFDDWIKKFGKFDKEEKLRVTILTGIDKKKPLDYNVCISSNLDKEENKGKLFITAARINRMTPASSQNLDGLINTYNKLKVFALMPAILIEGRDQPEILEDKAIIIKNLNIRQAWEIGVNDPDIMAIIGCDDPIIPEGIDNPPIVEALQQKRNLGSIRYSV